MATEQQLMEGLKRADAAGNTADAQHFADSIKEMRAAPKTSPAPQEKSGFPAGETMASISADPKYQTRNPIRDLSSVIYGAGTQAWGAGGDLGIPGFPTTGEVRGELNKVPGKHEATAPGQEGMIEAGELAPAIAGGAGLVKRGVEGGVKALGKVGDFVSDLGRGLKPRTLLEGGLGKPSTISHVGEGIQKKVEENLGRLSKERAPKAKKLFDAYLAKGRENEGAILEDYKKSLAGYYAEGVSSGKLSPEEAKAIHHAADRISGRVAEMGGAGGEKVAPGIGALEKERRFWNDVASGYDVKGAEAIPATAAEDIAKLLEKAIKKYAPAEYDAAMKGYQELSAPINKFNTALGKRAVAKADGFLPEMAKTDPALVPKAFFKTRRSVQELKDLTGDPKFAEEAAKSHVANDLARATTRAEVEKYMTKNADWLQEFPGLKKQLSDAAKTIGKGESAKTAGKVGLGILGAEGALALGRRTFGGP